MGGKNASAGAPNTDAHEVAVALFGMLGDGKRMEISKVAAELATNPEAYDRFRDIFTEAEKALRSAKARVRHQQRVKPQVTVKLFEHDTTASGAF